MIGDSVFFSAVMGNDMQKVEDILKSKKININGKDEEGFSTLHWAVFNGYEEIFDILLKAKICTDLQDNEGFTPLHWAVVKNHEYMLLNLLSYGANPNIKNKKGFTPLHYAAWNGFFNLVLILLNRKAVIDLKNQYGITPLYLAVSERHIKTAEILIEKGAEKNTKDKNGKSLLHLCVLEGMIDVLETLLIKKCEVNIQDLKGQTPLHYAIYGKNKNIAILLLRYGASIYAENYNGLTPLDFALSKTILDIEIIDVLVKNILDDWKQKSPHTFTPLLSHAAHGDEKSIDILLKNTLEMVKKGKKQSKIIFYLIEFGKIKKSQKKDHSALELYYPEIQEMVASPSRKTPLDTNTETIVTGPMDMFSEQSTGQPGFSSIPESPLNILPVSPFHLASWNFISEPESVSFENQFEQQSHVTELDISHTSNISVLQAQPNCSTPQFSVPSKRSPLLTVMAPVRKKPQMVASPSRKTPLDTNTETIVAEPMDMFSEQSTGQPGFSSIPGSPLNILPVSPFHLASWNFISEPESVSFENQFEQQSHVSELDISHTSNISVLQAQPDCSTPQFSVPSKRSPLLTVMAPVRKKPTYYPKAHIVRLKR